MSSVLRRVGLEGELMEWPVTATPDQALPAEVQPAPTSRWIRVEIPDGYVATITLTPTDEPD